MTASPAATAVETRLFGALAVLRAVLLANTVALSIYRADNFARPAAGAVCVGAMVVWTGVATWAYAEPQRRTRALLVADLAIALGLLALGPVVKGPAFSASVPGYWIMGALFAWAIHLRWQGGLAAGVLLAATDLALRPELAQNDFGNAFLLVVGGAIVGFMCGSLQEMAAEREVAERAAAVAAERARLARAVHDGVLQVLALVQRRGGELDGGAAELGRLAGEQERTLRALIRAQDDPVGPRGDSAADRSVDHPVDLTAALAGLERHAGITVSTPGRPVPLPAETARELLAAVGACLDNVRWHVGEDAPAWVLLESLPDRVEVSVRDEGPGIAAGRLDEAAAQGRLGVAESIRGRLADLGGSARLSTGAHGTEWELVVPHLPEGAPWPSRSG